MARVTLSDLLRSSRIQAMRAAFVELNGASGAMFSGHQRVFVHIVIAGRVTVSAPNAPQGCALEASECAVVLDAPVHSLKTDQRASAAACDFFNVSHSQDAPPTLRYGRGAPEAKVLTAAFVAPGSNGLLRAMPKLMTSCGAKHWLPFDTEAITRMAQGPGGAAFATVAVECVFTQLVRSQAVDLISSGISLATIQEGFEIPIALDLIDVDLARNWTIAELATEVGMSRSKFAAQFRETVGETPMQYITNCRMAYAAELLLLHSLDVSNIAFRVGYDSVASFTRAFRGHFNETPARYRRSHTIRSREARYSNLSWSPVG